MDMISRRRDVFLGLSQSIFSIKLFFSRVINVSISSVLVLPIIAVGVEFTVPSKRLHVQFCSDPFSKFNAQQHALSPSFER